MHNRTCSKSLVVKVRTQVIQILWSYYGLGGANNLIQRALRMCANSGSHRKFLSLDIRC